MWNASNVILFIDRTIYSEPVIVLPFFCFNSFCANAIPAAYSIQQPIVPFIIWTITQYTSFLSFRHWNYVCVQLSLACYGLSMLLHSIFIHVKLLHCISACNIFFLSKLFYPIIITYVWLCWDPFRFEMSASAFPISKCALIEFIERER